MALASQQSGQQHRQQQNQAQQSSRRWYGAWNQDKEYIYRVRSRTLAALPDMKDQYAGIMMKARLSVRPRDRDNVVMQLSDAQYAQVNEEMADGWDSDAPKTLQWKQMPISKKQFYVELKNGAIRGLYFDKEVTNDQANILKGIVSQFQVDTQAQNLIKCRRNQLPDHETHTAAYKTMEPSVHGKCKTMYDISPIPDYQVAANQEWAPMPNLKKDGESFIEVVKSTNLSNCDVNLGYHFGITALSSQHPGSNKMGEWFARSNVQRTILSGHLSNYTIQSSVTINKVVVSPELYNSNKAMVVSRVHVSLIELRDDKNEVPARTDDMVRTSLYYQYNNVAADNNHVQNYTSDSSSSS